MHEIPALPGAEEVAAIAAAQEAGALDNQTSDAGGDKPATDENKEG